MRHFKPTILNEDLELLDELTSKSKLTSKDALEISKIVDTSTTRKLVKMFEKRN